MQRGVSPETIEQELSVPPGTVFNLAYPGRAMIRSWVTLRDLIERGIEPQVVVLEVDTNLIRGLRKGKGASAWWPGSAPTWMTFEDIYSHWKALGYNTPSISQALHKKLTDGLVLNLSGHFRNSFTALGTEPKRRCAGELIDKPTKKKRARKNRKERALASDPNYQASEFDDRLGDSILKQKDIELFYLERIRKLVSGYGGTLLVIRPYGYLDKPLSPRVLQLVQSDIPEYRSPPKKFVSANNRHFIDTNHYDPKGRSNFSVWLAKEISAVQER
ncbi:MAG: hypothetical protein AAGF35_03205 [Pseudomonadota bacterium]